MKKKMAILLSAVMVLAFALAACGGGGNADLSDSKYVGTWVCNSVSLGDASEDFSGASWTMTLNGDGTGTLVATDESGAEEEVQNITWEPTNEGLKTKGDTKLKFEDEDGGIETKMLGVELHFVRAEDAAAADAAADTADDQAAAANGAAFVYTGNDPVQAAIYQYLAETIATGYDAPEGAVCVPVVQLVDEDVDDDDGEAEAKGDFWVYNYVIEGDTLKCVSGGNYAGKMDLVKSGDGYTVTEFEQVADGGSFEPTARDIFEEHYDAFMKVNSDEKTRESLRQQNLVEYVKANGLNVTKYQDEGWDPVDLAL